MKGHHEMTDRPDTDPDVLIDLLAGVDTWHTPAVADVPAIRMSDGPAGVRGTDWAGPASASFPCGSSLAATFDPELVREVGRALGREARSKSAHVLLGPTVNLHRTPVGGRNFECMSEDPWLTADIATAYVEGVQSERVACCIKHFVGNDTEFARMEVSSEIDERVLRELYLVPFEAAVAAGVRSIMTAYNRLNGTWCSEHEWLLTGVLRDEWGFDGLVVSDWFGTHSAAASLRAGLDVEMPGPPRHRGEPLRRALAGGEVTAEQVLAAAERVRALAEWTGARSTGTDETTADDPGTRAVIRRAAAAGSVLLRNEEGALPLPATATVALIGPYADTGRMQGGGSAKVRIDRPAGLLGALRERTASVEHAVGCRIDRSLPALRGEFTLELTDASGGSITEPRRRLELVRQDASDGLASEFAARVVGSFTPDSSGTWRIGIRSVGPCAVRFDGVEVVAVPPDAPGGSFFGYGSDEIIGTVDLVAGSPVQVEVDLPLGPNPGVRGFSVGGRPAAEPDLIAEAVELAGRAEVAVVVVGTNDEWETEGEDRTTIGLPGRQDELVSAVAAVNARTVVVVNAGAPVAMPWVDEVAAILHVWFPGGQLGPAITDVLVGDVEPGGRLPVTFPRRLEDTPAAPFHPGDGVRAHYGEGLAIGHRWYERERIEPLFPFGHGLGYTTFHLTDPELMVERDDAGVPTGVTVTAEVTNTGERPGSEVVQVYARYVGEHPGVEPLVRFVASSKVHVVPGATRRVAVEVPVRRLCSWIDGRWLLAPGGHELSVGRSSASRVGSVLVEV